MKRISSIAGRLLLSVFLMFVLFYTSLPAIHIRSRSFFVYVITCILIFLAVNFLGYVKDLVRCLGSGRRFGGIYRDPATGQYVFRRYGGEEETGGPDLRTSLGMPLKVGFAVIGVMIVFMAGASLVGHRFFNAARYRDLIIITEGDFTTDVAELRMSQIPVVDRDTASRLGSQKLGEMTELVSQFEIEPNYTQINYKGAPYRVTPLTYADPVKWLFNMSNGLPAYITVDMVTQDTDLVWLEQGMRYSPGEYFFRNIYRYIRFRYPTRMFETVSFEIDDNGTPYWVAPTITYRIGWWDGKDIDGAILVNAVTGESQFYPRDQVPAWIDQLYTSELIIEQLDDNGKFQNGYINSIFGQRGVRRTTYGYNYLASNDDVYLYTGMSSVTADESNIGFVLVNLRTKETRFYTVPGATEYSAMESAKGQVQHLGYNATFPLLLNISDRPTYFVSLKDAAGLVKMYAFVDVRQYQIVGTGATIDEAQKNYRQALNLEDTEPDVPEQVTVISGTIDAMESVVISGNTHYYFTLTDEEGVYVASITVSERLPFLKAGDKVRFTCTRQEQVWVVEELAVVSPVS